MNKSPIFKKACFFIAALVLAVILRGERSQSVTKYGSLASVPSRYLLAGPHTVPHRDEKMSPRTVYNSPAEIGIFGYNSSGVWYLDANGNGALESAPPDFVGSLGQTGDIPIVGDWTGTGYKHIGIFHSDASTAYFLLDIDGDGLFNPPGKTPVDVIVNLGQQNDVPVVGDWNGSGTDKVGIFRNGLWVLDYNGNFKWDGTSNGDKAYFGGQPGDKPVVGSWNGGPATLVGYYRDSVGTFSLDTNGDGSFVGRSYIGQTGDTPVVGDWSGDGRTKTGIFRNGLWLLDYNGDGQWIGGGSDRSISLGQQNDIPIVGDWNGSGAAKVGVYRDTLWVLDYNGNGVWDGTSTDRAWSYGNQGQGNKPVIGRWRSTQQAAQLAVTCSAGPSTTQAGNPITLTASATGGTTPYSYYWQVDNQSVGAGVSIQYNTTSNVGAHTAVVTVTDQTGATAAGSCRFNVTSATTNGYNCTSAFNHALYLVTADSGDVYADIQSALSTPSATAPDWSVQTTNAILSTPNGSTFGPANGPRVAGNAVSEVTVPDPGTTTLSQSGFGNYTLSANLSYSNPYCSAGSSSFSGVVNAPVPTVSSPSRVSGTPGANLSVNISGTGLTISNGSGGYYGITGVQVTQNGASASGVTASVSSIGNNSATVSIQISSSAIAGSYSINLEAFGVATNSIPLTVSDLPPLITSIVRYYDASSSRFVSGEGQVAVFISGQHFGSNPNLTVTNRLQVASNGSITVDGITGWSDTTISAYFTFTGDAAPGSYTVSVTSLGVSGQGYVSSGGTITGSQPANTATYSITVVPPTVTIDGDLGVPAGGGSSSFTIGVSDNSSIPIQLTIVASGSGSAQFGDTQSQNESITGSQVVTIQGLQASNSADDLEIQATAFGGALQLAKKKVSSVSVLISIDTSGPLPSASDDSAIAKLQETVGTPILTLGPVITNDSPPVCSVAVVLSGTVTPSDYKGIIILRKTATSRTYQGTAGDQLVPERNRDNDEDTSDPPFRDDDPQSGTSKGVVYDNDGPGVPGPNDILSVTRLRANFVSYAVLGTLDGGKASPNFNWYSRSSCTGRDANPSFSNDFRGDNQAGTGTTPLTYNLQ